MQYSRLGNTGLMVFRLSFSVMTEPAPLYPKWFHKFALDAVGDALNNGLHPVAAEVKA